MASARGFTLIELLVVLAILSMALVFLPPLFPAGVSTVSLKGAARDLATGLRYARSRAITQNNEMAVTIDVDRRTYAIEKDVPSKRLPKGAEIVLTTAQSERVGISGGRIRFFADGSSTGGRITIGYEARRYHVTVDWLTGRVAVTD